MLHQREAEELLPRLLALPQLQCNHRLVRVFGYCLARNVKALAPITVTVGLRKPGIMLPIGEVHECPDAELSLVICLNTNHIPRSLLNDVVPERRVLEI